MIHTLNCISITVESQLIAASAELWGFLDSAHASTQARRNPRLDMSWSSNILITLLMPHDAHREFKNRLYGQFARIGKAVSSPHRLEMRELLAQGERTVDSLATEVGLSLANTSQHLQALRQAALVESRKEGLFVSYRLSDPTIFGLCSAIRTVAERQLADLERLVREHFGDRFDAEAVEMNELLKRARSKRVVVLVPRLRR